MTARPAGSQGLANMHTGSLGWKAVLTGLSTMLGTYERLSTYFWVDKGSREQWNGTRAHLLLTSHAIPWESRQVRSGRKQLPMILKRLGNVKGFRRLRDRLSTFYLLHVKNTCTSFPRSILYKSTTLGHKRSLLSSSVLLRYNWETILY